MKLRISAAWVGWLAAASAMAAPVQDFGEINLPRLASRLKAISTAVQPVRITQLGDSHTAADYLTGTLRERFQAKFGDAGIGWTPPMAVPGQRHALVIQRSEGWALTNSRKDGDPDFPLGGYIAQAQKPGAAISLLPRNPLDGLWRVRFRVRAAQDGAGGLDVDDGHGSRKLNPPEPGRGWQTVEQKLYFPFVVRAGALPAVELGGIELERLAPGVVLDSIGSNGAQLSIWQRWGKSWSAQLAERGSDLVILAYGVNEAFDDRLDLIEYQLNLQAAINTIRRDLPQAAILMLGAQDAARKRGAASKECVPGRPLQLAAVKRIQQKVARDSHVLYWDWEQAMGGPCSMKRWQAQQLARPDMVHFSQQGYAKLADDLFDNLMARLSL